MNPFALMSLSGAVAVSFFGLYVYHTEPGSRYHRLFLVMSFVIGWWALSEFGFRQVTSAWNAAFFMRLGLIWPLAYALAFHISIEYTGPRQRWLRATVPFVYAVTLIFIVADYTTGIIVRELVPGTYGAWFVDIKPSPAVSLRFVWVTACGAGAVAVLGSSLRKERDNHRIKQIQLLMAGYLLPVVTSAVMDFLQIMGMKMPDYSVLGVVAGCMVFGYGMWRYKLFTIFSQEISEHLLPLLPDPLFIWRTDGIIEAVNDVACRVTGYSRWELTGSPMTLLCPASADLMQTRDLGNGRVIHRELAVKCKDGTVTPFALASVAVGSGPGTGRIMSLARDISVHHQRSQAQAEIQKMLEEMVASRTFLLEQALANQNFLWRTANVFASAGPGEDLYRIIVEQLRDFLGSAIVAVTSYKEQDKKLQIERFSGLGGYLEKVVSVYGHDPHGMAFPIPDEDVVHLSDAKLHAVPKGIHAVAPEIPLPVCRMLEAVLNITGLHSIGLVKDGKLFGNVTVVMQHGDTLTEKEAVETFISQASTALQRQHAERAIRTFSRAVMQEREEEMRELATSLHDELGSMAIGLQADLGVLEEDIKDGKNDEAVRDIERVRILIKDEIGRLKRISHNLRPLNLEILGLSRAIRELADYVTGRSGLRITCAFPEEPFPLTDRHAIALYRIVQEALNNVVRHARAFVVGISLENGPSGFVLTVKDDGCGFDEKTLDTDTAAIHMGLMGMRERAASLGGTLTIESSPQNGTAITVAIKEIEGNQL